MKFNKGISEKIKKLKALILDMDGVIVDTEPLHRQSFAILMDDWGMNYDENFLDSLVGFSVDENVERILKIKGTTGATETHAGIRKREKIYFELLNSAELKPVAGLKLIIDSCKRMNIKLALASSSILEQVNLIIKKLGLEAAFEVQISGNDVAAKKPAPDIYQKCLQQLAIQPDFVLAVEDSAAGVSSARSAGIDCIGILNRYANKVALRKANWQINSLLEFADLLKIAPEFPVIKKAVQ